MKSKLGIFAFYNTRGIVYRYVEKLLKEMKPWLDCLIVVCNGDISDDSCAILHRYADDILFRQNSGYDAGAYREALCKEVGWDKVRTYDQLILFNNSFFGPFYPMEEMFEKMDSPKVDFWGITRHAQYSVNLDRGNGHIQSYFLVINSRLLRSQDFENYWEQLNGHVETLQEAILSFEMTFTDYFEKRGYHWAVYAESAVFEGSMERPCNPYLYESFYLISEKRMPFLKCKNFEFFDSSRNENEDLKRAMDYLKEHTDYDTDMIWEYALDTYKLSDISRSYGMTSVLPVRGRLGRTKGLAVFFHVKYPASCVEIRRCMSCLKAFDEIFLVADSGVIKKLEIADIEAEENIHILEKKSWRDLQNLLVKVLEQREYICFLEDMEVEGTYDTVESGSDWYRICENLFGSEEYVDHIILHFDENPRLGMLTAPPGFHALRYQKGAAEWRNRETAVRKLVEQCCPGKAPEAGDYVEWMENAFWIRSDFARQLMQLTTSGYEKEDVLWALPFLAKCKGYYVETVQTTRYAEISLNVQREYIRKTEENQPPFFLQLLNALHYSRTYILGTGVEAQEAANIMKKGGLALEGILACGENGDGIDGIPVFALEERADLLKDAVVIVAIHGQEQEKYRQLLWKLGCTTVLLF